MTVDIPPKPMKTWKRLVVIGLSFGAGLAIIGAGIFGALLWYSSRPTPPKPWNTSSILANEVPGFGPSDDGKGIELRYALENATNSDYRVESNDQVKVLVKLTDGSLSRPFGTETAALTLPVFIPARQKGTLEVVLKFSEIPSRREKETFDDYHERLRSFLEKFKLVSFVLFDEDHHYQINLPKWSSKSPEPDRSERGP